MMIENGAAGFLREFRLDRESIDAEAVLWSFQREMTAGLSGSCSSLAMIPTYISADEPIPAHKPVVAVDAGGTHVRVATMVFDADGNPRIDSFANYKMPGLEKELGRDEFYERFVHFLLPVAPFAKTVGFCFSYPAEISPQGDGRLLAWTKEVRAPDVIGDLIGENISSRLRKKGFNLSFSLLNDTVAALLAGKSTGKARPFASYVGFILGTGTNTAYVESNRNITKMVNLCPEGKQVINVESGNFSQCPRSPLDLVLDKATDNPGQNTYEKMISGAYLGRLCLVVIKKAAEENLFSRAAAAIISALEHLATKDVDRFLRHPTEAGPLGSNRLKNEDRELLLSLFRALVDRAASLAAISIAAAVIKSGEGHDLLRPVRITAEGATFHKTSRLRRSTAAYLGPMLLSRGIYHELVQIPDASLIGAAVAGLTQRK